MNELTQGLDLTFTLFAKISATVCLPACTIALWRIARNKTTTQLIQSWPGSNSGGPTLSLAPVASSQGPLMVPIRPKATATVAVAVPTAAPEVKESEARQLEVECGNCRNIIKSAPLRNIGVDNKLMDLYHCEHCGTRVQVQVDPSGL